VRRHALTGRHAIITGGSSGIGKATARRLARAGSHVTIIARDPVRLEAARVEISGEQISPQQRVAVLIADVADWTQMESAMAHAIEHIGPPDILVTSAGIAACGYFSELPLTVFHQAMAINYFGTLHAIRAALPAMERQHRGHIVLLSSGAGLVGIYGYAPYSPTKFAVRGLGESLRGELRPRGIHVSIVYPPDTDTPQLEQENRTKPLETKMITGTAGIWSADAVAEAIVRGIAKRSFMITPGPQMTLLGRLHSLLAPALTRYFDRLATRARRSPS
jgi:3-dehydrosphinganine reductase